MAETAGQSLNAIAALRGPKLVITVIGLMLTLFLAVLDSTIVGTALPRIVADLQGIDRYSWVATAYLLASTAMIPIVSKLSDIYGRKQQLVISIIGFVAGSALCGLSQTMDQLIVFRLLQGIAGGGLFTLVFASVADIFPPAERGKYQGLFFGMVTSASIAGPVIGGYLTEHLSWRWIFYVNLPVCAIALTFLILGMPRRSGPVKGGLRRIDFPGAALLTLSICTFLLSVVVGEESFNWLTPQSIGLFVVAIVGFILFLRVEKRAVEPILPLDIFAQNKIVGIGTTGMFFGSMLMVAASIYSPLYIQAVLGDSPSQSGFTLLPQLIMAFVVNVTNGQVMSRIGRYRPSAVLGSIVLPLSILMLVLVAPLANKSLYIVATILFGIGFSLLLPALNLAVLNALPPDRMGAGTGMTNLIRSVGQSLGAALIGSIAIGSYRHILPSRISAETSTLPPETVNLLTDAQRLFNPAAFSLPPNVDPELAQRITDSALSAMTSGIQNAFIAMFVIAAIGGVYVIARLPEVKLRRTKGIPVQETEASKPVSLQEATP